MAPEDFKFGSKLDVQKQETQVAWSGLPSQLVWAPVKALQLRPHAGKVEEAAVGRIEAAMLGAV
jgi:hypothetical protein